MWRSLRVHKSWLVSLSCSTRLLHFHNFSHSFSKSAFVRMLSFTNLIMIAVEYEDSFRFDDIWNVVFEIRNDTNLDCDDRNTLSDTKKTDKVMKIAEHTFEISHKYIIASCDSEDSVNVLSCLAKDDDENALQSTTSCSSKDAHQFITSFSSIKQASKSIMKCDIDSKVASFNVKLILCDNSTDDSKLNTDFVTNSTITFIIDSNFDCKDFESVAQSSCDTKILQSDLFDSDNRDLSSTQSSAILSDEKCDESRDEAQSQTTEMSKSAQIDLETSRNRLTHVDHFCVLNVSTNSTDLMINSFTSTNIDELKTVVFTTDSLFLSNFKLYHEWAYADLISARLFDDAIDTNSLRTMNVDDFFSILKR